MISWIAGGSSAISVRRELLNHLVFRSWNMKLAVLTSDAGGELTELRIVP
jgi:hypothetical protein